MTAAVKERPILFSAPMVRALLDGSKTQTRRIMKPQPVPIPGEPGKHWWPSNQAQSMVRIEDFFRLSSAYGAAGDHCPHGAAGDRLWVRETWAQPAALDPGPTVYRADYPACVPAYFTNLPSADEVTWKPSIHMFRRDSRILLEIVSVRVERLNDIGTEEIEAEGVETADADIMEHGCRARVIDFAKLWESINGAGSWAANPWVWVVEFKRVAP